MSYLDSNKASHLYINLPDGTMVLYTDYYRAYGRYLERVFGYDRFLQQFDPSADYYAREAEFKDDYNKNPLTTLSNVHSLDVDFSDKDKVTLNLLALYDYLREFLNKDIFRSIYLKFLKEYEKDYPDLHEGYQKHELNYYIYKRKEIKLEVAGVEATLSFIKFYRLASWFIGEEKFDEWERNVQIELQSIALKQELKKESLLRQLYYYEDQMIKLSNKIDNLTCKNNSDKLFLESLKNKIDILKTQTAFLESEVDALNMWLINGFKDQVKNIYNKDRGILYIKNELTTISNTINLFLKNGTHFSYKEENFAKKHNFDLYNAGYFNDNVYIPGIFNIEDLISKNMKKSVPLTKDFYVKIYNEDKQSFTESAEISLENYLDIYGFTNNIDGYREYVLRRLLEREVLNNLKDQKDKDKVALSFDYFIRFCGNK